MKNKNLKNKNVFTMRNSNGFVALFAVLLSMLILTMALGIISVSLKETQLSIESKNGNIALFAADSGIECALYGDVGLPGGFGDADSNSTDTFECVGADFKVGDIGTLDFTIDSAFTAPDYDFLLYLSGTSCANVFVNKNYEVIEDVAGVQTTVSYTKIDSYGYNVSCDNLNTTSNKRVERALRITYPN